nr:hypothetical protein [Tanacetum cinerariifolium]
KSILLKRVIVEMDPDVDVVLEEAKEVAEDAKEDEFEPAEVQAVVDVVTTAKIITKVVTTASETITAASETITAAEAQVFAATLTVAPARVTAAPEEPKPLKKQQQIEQDKNFPKQLEAELNKNIDWDEAIDLVKKKAKEDPAVKRYQVLKRKPQTKAQAKKNMMVYLKNVVGFKMDYSKGMSYDDIRPIFEAKFNINKSILLKRVIAEMDPDVDVVLEEAKEVAEDAKVDESVDIQGRKAESQAEIY